MAEIVDFGAVAGVRGEEVRHVKLKTENNSKERERQERRREKRTEQVSQIIRITLRAPNHCTIDAAQYSTGATLRISPQFARKVVSIYMPKGCDWPNRHAGKPFAGAM